MASSSGIYFALDQVEAVGFTVKYATNAVISTRKRSK